MENKETQKKDGNIFGICPEKTCKRPYKKGDKFPKEVCPTCIKQGIKYTEKKERKKSVEKKEKEVVK